jgi:hypothetical protein
MMSARTEDAMTAPDEPAEMTREPAGSESDRPRYWAGRQDMLYYQVVRIVAAGLAADAGSVLDVGSRGTPYLEWFPGVPVRTSLDLVAPYRAAGIQSLATDFLTWEPDRRYDLVTCLQVLEHVTDATTFARRLLAAGRIVLISVPYRWRAGQSKHHVHDPVTLDKVRAWFGREPSFRYVVREPSNGFERLVCVFDEGGRTWTSLAQRAGKPGFRPAPTPGLRSSSRALLRRARATLPGGRGRRGRPPG